MSSTTTVVERAPHRSATRVSTGIAEVSVTLERGVTRFAALEPEWRRLVANHTAANPFLAWEWAFTWVETMIGDRLVTAVARSGTEVVAIAPFADRAYGVIPGLRGRCLQLFGPRERQHVFELREVPIAPGMASKVIPTLLQTLFAHGRWDWLELSAFSDAAHEWRSALSDSLGPWQLAVENRVEVPILPLPASWEELQGRLRRNVKERIRRGYNGLRRDGIDYQVEWWAAPGREREGVAELLRLHALRAGVTDRKRHADAFAPPELQRFLRLACERMMAAGQLEFAAMRIGDEIVAIRLHMRRDGSLYLYYSGFDPEWWDRSVMTVLVAESVKRAIEQGFSEINFSPGVDQAKQGWTEPTDYGQRAAFLAVRASAVSRVRLSAFRRRVRLTARLRRLRG